MKTEKQYYVYILTNKWNKVLYVGVTNDLQRRVLEHRDKTLRGFTQRYNVDKPIYFEATESIESAILREKQLKGGSRKQRIALIESVNPEWKDLYQELFVNP
jgi:putative endonuclease